MALAKRLAEAGYTIPQIIVRRRVRGNPRSPTSSAKTSVGELARDVGARVETMDATGLIANVIWFCVPDAVVPKAAARLADGSWQEKIVFHSSGVLTSAALAQLKKQGAKAASVHPLMTFVSGSVPELRGVTFAIEGDPAATRAASKIVRDLGGDAIHLRQQDKVAYHAFATMICPLLVSLLTSSEAVASLAGILSTEARRRMMPIIQQTLENYLKLGPAGSFSGPIVRGDAETVQLHLQALSKTPAARKAYVALALAALEYLPSRRKRELQKLLLRQASSTST